MNIINPTINNPNFTYLLLSFLMAALFSLLNNFFRYNMNPAISIVLKIYEMIDG